MLGMSGEDEQKNEKKKLNRKIYKKNPILNSVSSFDRFSVPHQPDNGPHQSEIGLSRVKTRISAHWNKFAQNWWFFAISPNTGCFANFPLKCGGFLELTRLEPDRDKPACLD
jgi:hypothetical protein